MLGLNIFCSAELNWVWHKSQHNPCKVTVYDTGDLGILLLIVLMLVVDIVDKLAAGLDVYFIMVFRLMVD